MPTTYRVRFTSHSGGSDVLGEGYSNAEARKTRDTAVRRALRFPQLYRASQLPDKGGRDVVEVADDGTGLIPYEAGFYVVEAFPHVRNCAECGSEFQPEREPPPALSARGTCSHTCNVAYNGLRCDCEECAPPEEDADDVEEAEEGEDVEA